MRGGRGERREEVGERARTRESRSLQRSPTVYTSTAQVLLASLASVSCAWNLCMSLMKDSAILDDGRRCQSCCNRCQLFGDRDVVSRWMGDCRECNIRWYRDQIRYASRGMNRMIAEKNLWGLGSVTTALVFRYAGLDIKFERSGAIFDRQRQMLKSTLTNMVESDDEYMDGPWEALRTHPLTFLDDCRLMSPSLEHELLRDLPRSRLTVLDVIVMFLIKRPRRAVLLPCPSQCAPCAPSYCDFQGCTLTRVQSRDYVFEAPWMKYEWQGRHWMYNTMTEEGFFTDNPPFFWTAYRYGHAVWWLNGKRWFWENYSFACKSTPPDFLKSRD